VGTSNGEDTRRIPQWPPRTESKVRSPTTGSRVWPTGGPSAGSAFKGQPEDGSVEIGYGLTPSGRGHGYATEAVIALLAVAADHGVSRVIADTTLDNIASQRTLVRAGFRLVSSNAELPYYEVLL
jgi:RimJ/RimL family protein N-acetyltransferase